MIPKLACLYKWKNARIIKKIYTALIENALACANYVRLTSSIVIYYRLSIIYVNLAIFIREKRQISGMKKVLDFIYGLL